VLNYERTSNGQPALSPIRRYSKLNPVSLLQEERDPVAPKEGEATVAIEMTGICGSDRELAGHG